MIKVEWDKYRLLCLICVQWLKLLIEDVTEYLQRVWDLILHEETNLVSNTFQNGHFRAGCEDTQNLAFSSACYIWKYDDASCVCVTNLSISQETPEHILTVKMLEWCLSRLQTRKAEFFDLLISMVHNLAQSRNHFQEQLVCGNPAVKAKKFNNMKICCSVPDDLNASE